MNKLLRLLTVAAAVVFATVGASAKYVDATSLRIVNRGWDNARITYGRIPVSLMAQFNSVAQGNADCSAGVGVRFATNSRSIGVKYTLKTNTHMNHQAATGTKGMCLYILDDNVWRYCNTVRPADQRNQEQANLLTNMDGTWHEFMFYLPTYDGCTDMEVIIDDNAEINHGNYDAIDASKRVVAYGTSILQGGCSSRPGMCPTAILSRMLNCEVINLAFSGGGKMEKTAAEAIATIQNVSAFIVDPVPNCDDVMCRDLTYDFVKTLRDAHPGVPVIMVEGHMYPYGRYNSYFQTYIPTKNKYFRENYEKLYAEDPTNLFYVTSQQLDAACDEGTVEGVHFTDLGFQEYAKLLAPILEPFCRGVEPMAITTPSHGTESASLEPEIAWSHAQREGTVEIYDHVNLAANHLIYSGKGVGSVQVPRYALAGGTHYYARVAYDGGNSATVYTPVVEFSTMDIVADVPTFVNPVENGTLHSNEAVKFAPVEGATSIRLEISATQTFPARSTYVSSTIGATTQWTDVKEASEIRIGGAAMTEGVTYYARARVTYMMSGSPVTTEYTPVITFKYSQDAGVQSVMADAPETISTQTYDAAGRRAENVRGITLTRATKSNGEVTVTKEIRR